MSDRLYAVIPAYNEEANIGQIIAEWHTAVEKFGGGGSRLVVVNDGSRDATLEKARALQARFPLLEVLDKPNSGHGATVRFAYEYALKSGADWIFQTDSDGQTLPEEFEAFWNLRGDYDLVIGHRKGREDGFSRVVVTKTLRAVVRLCFGVRTADANTPFRLMSAGSLRECLAFVPEGFNLANVVLTVAYHKKNLRVKYLPVTFRPRQGGVNSINIGRIFRIGAKAPGDFLAINRRFKEAGL